MNPFQVVRDFEAELCRYTGAPFAVTTTSCTMALLLAVKWCLESTPYHYLGVSGSSPLENCAGFRVWHNLPAVEIPKRTYVSVPMSIIHAGGRPTFRDEEWAGAYQLKPFPVWDSARWFTGGMCIGMDAHSRYTTPFRNCAGQFVCTSCHASKTLGDTQGGAILHDNPEADAWLRRARFDGRTEGVHPKNDTFTQVGWHCYMSPDVAARLLHKLSVLPKHNEPLQNDEYPDLSKMEIFR